MEAPRKRQRANTNGDSAVPQTARASSVLPAPAIPEADMKGFIDILHAADNGQLVKDFSLECYIVSPIVASMMRRFYNYHGQLQEERSVEGAGETGPGDRAGLEHGVDAVVQDGSERDIRPTAIDFQYYADHVWHAINERYSKCSSSKQWDASFVVTNEIDDITKVIQDKATQAHAHPETQRSALETLRNIGVAICNSTDEIGYRIRIMFQLHTGLLDAMKAIIDKMTDDERKRLREMQNGEASFVKKMRRFQRLAGSYCILKGVGGVIEHLYGEEAEVLENLEEPDSDEGETGWESGSSWGPGVYRPYYRPPINYRGW
ncbi:uncharacterized protein J4E92_001441 [Alternaria infectoria]|uniref:uncharacterized protein n=1 Tax=Alternaria infectoria TaxID=45303 RepID=UPI00221E8B61|nr:uncharacterized protein J4E92_001441 [Alternaria infectoria]KAI4936717.1 hypothetical protein J4E92_001441 [Alternaria infectoria]